MSLGTPRSALLAFALLLGTFVTALGCEGGHWIEEVTDDGAVVILEDGSIWAIDGGDEVETALWLPTTDITACPDKLINTEDGEVADAHRIR
jgi:hypothetical protein